MEPSTRILVTRPTQQATPMLEALIAHGFEALHLPLIKIEPISNQPEWVTDQRDPLASFNTLIFISPNAVTHSLPWIADGLKSNAKQQPHNIFGVGMATCKLLKDHGFQTQPPPTLETSEGLIAQMEAHGPMGKCLLIKGTGGRNELEQWLSAQHTPYEVMQVYRRAPEQHTQATLQSTFTPPPGVICITSGSSLEALHNLKNRLDIDILTCPLLVPSYRVAEIGQKLGFRTIFLSAGAGAEAQVTAITAIVNSEIKPVNKT